MFCDFSRHTFLSKGAMNHNLRYLKNFNSFRIFCAGTQLQGELQAQEKWSWSSGKLQAWTLGWEGNGANLNVCDWRISQRSTHQWCSVPVIQTAPVSSTRKTNPDVNFQSRSLLKALDQSSVIQQLLLSYLHKSRSGQPLVHFHFAEEFIFLSYGK